MLASNRPIREGGSASAEGEDDVYRAVNHCIAIHSSPIADQTFHSDKAGTPYVEAKSTSYEVRAAWRRQPFLSPLANWEISIFASNPGTQSGTVKFDLESDPGTYSITQVVPASTATLTGYRFTLPYDDSQSLDTIRMWVKNDSAGGQIRIHSVEIRPYVPSSSLNTLVAGQLGHGIEPIDGLEVDDDSPCSVHLRNAQLAALQAVWQKRTDTIYGWSEDLDVRAGYEAHQVAGSAYVLVGRIGFTPGPRQTALRWSLLGYRSGSAGSVKLTTDYEIFAGIAAQEISLGSTWTSPYTAAWHDDGGNTLACIPGKSSEVKVWLKGDGSNEAYLQGLNLWFEELD